MKFKLHNLEFEIEGKEAVVKEEFQNFKEFITGQLLSKINVIAPQVTSISQEQPITKQIKQPQDTTVIELGDYPVLKEVVKKDLPKTESDWILIYAFYSSSYGENTFTEKDIRKQYEATGRNNRSRLNNISNNIKSLLKQEYIKVHNETEYLMKDEGLNYAKQILQGNSTSKTVKRISAKSKNTSETKNKGSEEQKTKKGKASSSVGFIDLELPSAELKSLNDFFASKKPKTQNEEVAVVMKWYKEHIKSNEISLQEINYLLSITSKAPATLAQILGNMVGASFRWVTKGTKGKYQLSSIGENYVMNKLPKASK